MTPLDFISRYKEYFGPEATIPVAVMYSDIPLSEPKTIPGCMFKQMHRVFKGEAVSFSAQSLTCGGGKFYTGLDDMPDRVPNFVSLCEKYKKTPELVRECVKAINVHRSHKVYLNLVRVDRISSFDGVEGIIFFAGPDIISGLFAWANYDSVVLDAVKVSWGSGCSSTVTALVNENRANGQHCFLGMLDVSARPYFRPDILSFSIPMSRLKNMLPTLSECCVNGAPAWQKVRKRINQ